jgi:hypothetical protein
MNNRVEEANIPAGAKIPWRELFDHLGVAMSTKGTNHYMDWQRKVTEALLKFCEDHKYPTIGLTEIRDCLKALERKDIKTAVESYRKVPLGGRMGYFDDWLPPVVFPQETPEYVQIVFRALLNEWDRVMKLSLAES